MIGYPYWGILQACGGVMMCFGVKRLFTVHGVHRLPRKCARWMVRLWRSLSTAVRKHFAPVPRKRWIP